jgi:hypothetical protein
MEIKISKNYEQERLMKEIKWRNILALNFAGQ